jgi:hypothetical protein
MNDLENEEKTNTSEFFFGDKVREGLTLVGVFLEGTIVTR